MPENSKDYLRGVEDGRRNELIKTLQDGLGRIEGAMAEGLKTVHERINAMEKDNCKPRADRLTKVETSLLWMRRIAGGVGVVILAVIGWLIYIVIERKGGP